jgi:hypothetical protein
VDIPFQQGGEIILVPGTGTVRATAHSELPQNA